jgi:hypothetical protein
LRSRLPQSKQAEMKKQIQNFRDSIRTLKSNVIYKYYQFRIEKSQDPYQIRFRKSPYRILFILSHMRSGSSLLTHLLNSNSDIIGYGETHVNYTKKSDFKQLMFKVYWQFKEIGMSHQYILDKILHDSKIVDNTLLTSENLYNIFLIREPKRALTSLLALKPHWSEEKALNYYIQRLSTLEKYAKIINSKERSMWLDYDQLLDNSNLVFQALKNFLGTKEGFSEEYKILKTTGLKGIGDSSENIKAGRIIKTAGASRNSISAESLEKALLFFNQCSATLSEYCSSVERFVAEETPELPVLDDVQYEDDSEIFGELSQQLN